MNPRTFRNLNLSDIENPIFWTTKIVIWSIMMREWSGASAVFCAEN